MIVYERGDEVGRNVIDEGKSWEEENGCWTVGWIMCVVSVYGEVGGG